MLFNLLIIIQMQIMMLELPVMRIQMEILSEMMMMPILDLVQVHLVQEKIFMNSI